VGRGVQGSYPSLPLDLPGRGHVPGFNQSSPVQSGGYYCFRERDDVSAAADEEGSSTSVGAGGGAAAAAPAAPATSALLVDSSGVLDASSRSCTSLTECSADCCWSRCFWWNACREKRRWVDLRPPARRLETCGLSRRIVLVL